MTDLRAAAEMALNALESAVENECQYHDYRHAADTLRQALAQPEQKPVSSRENAIIRFALHQFMSNAYLHLSAAAQDKDNRRYPPEAVEKFSKDAKDAEALLERWQYTAPPSKPWVSLTGDEIDDIASESGFGYINVARAIEAALKDKNHE